MQIPNRLRATSEKAIFGIAILLHDEKVRSEPAKDQRKAFWTAQQSRLLTLSLLRTALNLLSARQFQLIRIEITAAGTIWISLKKILIVNIEK